MTENTSSIDGLKTLARQYQDDIRMASMPITPAQIKKIQTMISSSKLKLSRFDRLEILRRIFGYRRQLRSTADLSIADAHGLFENLTDEDFSALLTNEYIHLEGQPAPL